MDYQRRKGTHLDRVKYYKTGSPAKFVGKKRGGLGLERRKHSFLCPYSPVFSIDSGHCQTAVVEVEPLDAIQCDMLEELKFGWIDRGMGTGDWQKD